MTHNTEVEEVVEEFKKRFVSITHLVEEDVDDPWEEKEITDWLRTTLHHQLQKAREEERERIEAVFKEHVPPHAMDLEDSVWLKRLLNKAFQHENIY